jgi:PAS domain-containing protein
VNPFAFYLNDEEDEPTGSEPSGETKGEQQEKATTEPPAAPAAEQQEQPQEFVLPENLQLPDDVDHGFYKGKKLADVIAGVKNLEQAKVQAETTRNQTLREQAALRVQLRMVQEELEKLRTPQSATTPPTQEDIYSTRGIDLARDWNLDPEKVEPALVEKIERRLEKKLEERLAQAQQASKQERESTDLNQRVISIADAAMEELGIDPSKRLRAYKAAMPILTDMSDEYAYNGGPLSKENFLKVLSDDLGYRKVEAPAPTPTPVVTPIAEPPAPRPRIPNPPGEAQASRPAITNPKEVLQISEVDRLFYRNMAESIGKSTEEEIEAFIRAAAQDFEASKKDARRKR